uniref:F-box domain-containing protein n=2 Tax=Steinernema glaseri TaxID=37863 RepID=A0A1I7YIL4_9BILA
MSSTISPFNRNLIKNPSGELGFTGWKISGRQYMAIEEPPERSNKNPFVETTHCFAGSYSWSDKTVVVDLVEEGLSAEFIDIFSPPIRVSEWVSHRDDCGAFYNIEVRLLDAVGNHFKEEEATFKFHRGMSQWRDLDWLKVEHTFLKYPKGVRKVQMKSGGQDSQNWAGNYGPKMAHASIVVEDGTVDRNPLLFDCSVVQTEILEKILARVEKKTLLQSVPLVCREWKEILSRQSFWVEKARVDGQGTSWVPPKDSIWEEMFKKTPRLYHQKPFNRNLIPNPSGEDGMRHWAVTNLEINVESPPENCLPNAAIPTPRCFATNGKGTEKKILIDLVDAGIDADVLNRIRPRITVSEWFTHCGTSAAEYSFSTVLYDFKKIPISPNAKFTTKKSLPAGKGILTKEGQPIQHVISDLGWTKVEHVFTKYPRGVRFVRLASTGRAIERDSGHVGAKMAHASVIVGFEYDEME